jgi:acyl carrier protein
VSRDEIKAAVLRALGGVAPEADLARLDAAVPFRDQLDLDSMDVLNFAIALHAALGVDVPEADYARIATLNGCLDYLEVALKRQGAAGDPS